MTRTEASTRSLPQPTERRSWRSIVLLVVLFILIAVSLYVSMLTVPLGYWLLGVRVLVIILASALPVLIYNYFIQGRGRILYREYRQNLRRLGYPDVAQQYREKFEAIYGRVRVRVGDQADRVGTEWGDADPAETLEIHDINLRPMSSPIIVATLFTFVGWILVFYPVIDFTNMTLIPSPTPVAFGFLGAYVFGLGALVRQYVTDDLQPRYYASLTVRYLTVFVLSWLIVLILQLPLADAALPASSAISLSQADQVLIVAFFIGMFPATGLRLIQRSASLILGVAFPAFKEDHPLSMLEGLNAYQEDRLQLEGIENLQNLACANIIDLMLKTRFPVEQIVDWIDQALLCLHAGANVTNFRHAGLRTATDFLDVYDATAQATTEAATRRQQFADLIEEGGKEASGQTKVLALFDTMAVAMRSDPNMFHIRYWRAHAFEALPEDIERMRISADLQLMQGLVDEAIEIYNDLLREFPSYPSVLLYRGLAHFSRKEYAAAIADYTEALTRGGKQWSNARYAYVERGRALRQLEDYDQAVKNYQMALQEYPNFPEAQMELAFVQMTRLNQYDAAIANLDSVIVAKFKEAEAYANRGVARYERWKFQNRPPEMRDAELGQARADLERALRLKPALTLYYVNLALIQHELGQIDAQEQTLTRALQQLETTPAPDVAYRVRLERGYLYQQRGQHDRAVADFEAATQVFDHEPAAYVFLGAAQLDNGQAASAEKAVLHAITLNAHLTSAQLQLGKIYLARNKSKEAEETFGIALQLARAEEDPSGQMEAHLGLARAYRQQALWQDARREAHNAVQGAHEVNDVSYTDATYEIGLAEAALGNLDEAARSFLNCAVLYETLNRPRQSVAAYYQLASIETDVEKKRTCLDKALALLDNVFDPRSSEDAQLRTNIQQALTQLPAPPPATPGTP